MVQPGKQTRMQYFECNNVLIFSSLLHYTEQYLRNESALNVYLKIWINVFRQFGLIFDEVLYTPYTNFPNRFAVRCSHMGGTRMREIVRRCLSIKLKN